MIRRTNPILACLCLAMITAMIAGCSAQTAGPPAIPVGALAVPNAGVIYFCATHPDECGNPQPPLRLALTDRLQRQLALVNDLVNQEITPIESNELAWHYPINGRGDCVQYALEKRRRLRALGVPVRAMALTSAVTERGQPHLVLVVRTTEADLVLDNRVPDVRDWRALPYHWEEQQDGPSLAIWRQVVVADGRGS